MEWFWLIVAAGGAGFGAKWWRARRAIQRADADGLERVRHLAEEDVACLGELLLRFHREVGEQSLDDQTNAAYQIAVECYESAQRSLSRISRAEEVGDVTHIISTARHALACAQARLAGHPTPRRVMCFFNPQHGPSAGDVLWTRPGHGQRAVPACPEDVQRVADKLGPGIRVVNMGNRTAPYWAAGSAFLPYTRGYFATTATLAWACYDQVADAAAGAGAPGYFGTGIVGSSGNFDGGGFDGSGAP
jgi:hypothetical protein